MDINQKVDVIMQKRLLTLHPKDKIIQAKELFKQYDIHHIPIVVLNKIVGIISLGDILFLTKKPALISFDNYLKEKKLSIGTLEEIMSVNVVDIDQDATIREAITKMTTHRINALPVVDSNEEIVGLITTYDIMKNLIKE